ncbi:hypothetical protein ACFPRL_15775 [Pseudoclavibacter helvolus]
MEPCPGRLPALFPLRLATLLPTRSQQRSLPTEFRWLPWQLWSAKRWRPVPVRRAALRCNRQAETSQRLPSILRVRSVLWCS